jgi:Tfp pilus assembly protein PilV
MVKQSKGVVLVDVLVAAMLLGIAVAAMVSLTGRALSSQRQGEELQTAAMLLDEQLQLVLARGPDDYASRFPIEGPCDAPFESYRYTLKFDGGEGGDPYRIIATVSWNASGRTRSESIETFIAPRLGEEPDPIRKPADPVLRY